METSDRRQYLALITSTSIFKGSFIIAVELFLFLVYPGNCFVFGFGFGFELLWFQVGLVD